MSKLNKNFAPVSVIIPCYYCHDTVERACLSVVNQSLIPSQIVLIEDASDDDGKTSKKIRSLSKTIENTWGVECTTIFLKKNVGPGEARNHGWEVAKYNLIAFLDADDAWHPSKIEIQFSWMLANPSIDITCHKSVLFDRYHHDLPFSIESVDLQFHSMLYQNRIQTRTVMLKRALPNRFLKGQRFSEDYRLWLNILAEKKSSKLLNVELASTYRPEYSGRGQSAKLWKMEHSELKIYYDLYCDKKLVLPWLLSSSLFSITKFFIRTLKSSMRALNILAVLGLRG